MNTFCKIHSKLLDLDFKRRGLGCRSRVAIKGKVFQEDFEGLWQEKQQAGSSRLLGKRKGTWEEDMILTPSRSVFIVACKCI